MKLLLDQNLSPKLAGALVDLFPGSVHVQTIALDSVDDTQIWEFARRQDLTIVTKDEDYSALSVLRGAPPKVIWLQLGNCTTAQVESALRIRFFEIATFEKDPAIGVFVLS